MLKENSYDNAIDLLNYGNMNGLNYFAKKLKENPTVKNANEILFNLAEDGGLYDDIRDYRGGEYCPKDIVVDSIGDLIANEDKQDGKLDYQNQKDVEKYDDTDWIDYNTIEPVTAQDVMDIINYLRV